LKAAYDADIKKINDMAQDEDDMTNASEFAEQKERLKAARKARYEADVAAKRGRRVPGGPAPPDAADADGPLQPLCNKFYAEWDALYTFHKENKDALAKGPGKFGEPLAPMLGAPRCPARYAFWPSKKDDWPLLYFCAEIILAGCKHATAANERMHSRATRINSRLRARMSVERLTMAFFYLRKAANELAEKVPVDANGVDFSEVALAKVLKELGVPASEDDGGDLPAELIDELCGADPDGPAGAPAADGADVELLE
jgi:hypothetical protein